MNTAARLNAFHSGVTCTAPKIGARVPDFIVEQLDETAAEEVETHLANCLHCKRRYLAVLQMRAEREARADDSTTPSASNGRPRSTD